MGINFKLAYDGLKRNRRDTVTTTILAVIIMATLLTITNLATTYSDAINLKELKESGKWMYYLENINNERYQSILKNNQEVATLEKIGTCNYDSGGDVTILSNNFSALVNQKIIEGTYPTTGEIALTSTILSSLGYRGEIGEIVTIIYQDYNDNDIEIQAKLSGIILEDRMMISQNNIDLKTGLLFQSTHEIIIGEIILPPQPVINPVSLFVYDKELQDSIEKGNYLDILSKKVEIVSSIELSQILHNPGYAATTAQSLVVNMSIASIILGVMLVTMIIMLGITFSSLNRKAHEYTLLRAIGQTKTQMFRMLLSQLLLISITALILGIVLSYLSSYLGLLVIRKIIYQNALLTINFDNYLGMICCGLAIIFIGMFLPSFQASRKSLSGKFDAKVHKYFSVKIKKLYYQNIFQLAKREFIKNKSLNFILILIITGSFTTINNFIMMECKYNYNLDSYDQKLNSNEIFISGNINLRDDNLSKYDGLTTKQINYFEQLGDHIMFSKFATSTFDGYSWKGIENSINDNYIFPYFDNLVSAKNLNYYAFVDNSNSAKEIQKYINGRLPETNNEIVVYLPYTRIIDGELIPGKKSDGYDTTIKIGTTIKLYEKIKNNEYDIDFKNQIFPDRYQVVGIINELPNNIIDFEPMSFIISENEFNQRFDQNPPNHYEKIYLIANNKNKTLAKLNEFNQNHTLTIKEASKNFMVEKASLKHEYETMRFYTVFLLFTSLFLFSYLTRYRITNNISMIGTLKSIGITKVQLYCLYGYQAILICLGSLFFTIWTIIYTFNHVNEWTYPYLKTSYIFTIICLVVIVVNCLPLKKLLKQDILEMIKIHE